MSSRHGFKCLFSILIFFFCTSASAAEQPTEDGLAERPYRPVDSLAIEVNPLAMVGRRFGGQLQVGILGPLSLVGGASYLEYEDTQSYAPSDERMSGVPSLDGFAFEVGGRAHLVLGRNKPAWRPFYLWLGFSILHDRFTEGRVRSIMPSSRSTSPIDGGAETDLTRFGVAGDIGFHIGIANGFYVTAGVGLAARSTTHTLVKRSSSFAIVDELLPSMRERSPITPRLLCSIGWGF